MVRVKILPHKTPDVALVEFETATQACIARNHLDQVQMRGKSNIVLPQVRELKFRYSEKATKILPIFHSDLTLLSKVKKSVKDRPNFCDRLRISEL